MVANITTAVLEYDHERTRGTTSVCARPDFVPRERPWCYCLDAAQRIRRGMDMDSLWRHCNQLLYNCSEWPCATAF